MTEVEQKLLKALDIAIYKLKEMQEFGQFREEHEENFQRNIRKIETMRDEAVKQAEQLLQTIKGEK